ncbi:hypothetical protein ACQ5SO_06275 [Rhodovulum sp. DZ06]|uniref:hypothetical protein n=1 Tax=Rhodovulum sp. DZ06 TaxID=3425126 RepID=UPI003D357C44
MSIIRLSVLGDGTYAPDQAGNISPEEFSSRRGKDSRGEGRMDKYLRGARPRPGDPLWRYLEKSLSVEAAKLPADKPVTVMVHGFQFDPASVVMRPPHHHKADNPHARLYHFEEHDELREMKAHSTSWPLGLGFAEGDGGAEGLCIGFGWYSNPGFFSSLFDHGMNFYAKAYRNAEDAAWQLLCTLEILTTVLDRKVDLFCHSLGSRVVVRALAMAASPLSDLGAMVDGRLTPGAWTETLDRVDRVVILAGAEKVLEAQLMMSLLTTLRAEGTDVTPWFFNIVSRENDVLDKLGENFGPSSPGSKQVIGHNGLEKRDVNWVDVQLDDVLVGEWFHDAHGLKISGDNQSSVFAVMDHWIHYTWRDNMKVYNRILRERDAWSVPGLKAVRHKGEDIFNKIRLNRGKGFRSFD